MEEGPLPPSHRVDPDIEPEELEFAEPPPEGDEGQ
jgi:hypothetical protein